MITRSRHMRRVAIAVLLVVLIGIVAVHVRLVPFAWHWVAMQINWDRWQDRAIGLQHYVVTIEGLELAGIRANLSGLTYSEHSGTLYSVVNNPPLAVELSTDGQVLRILSIDGLRDVEGISHVAGDLFVLSDENEQGVTFVRIGPEDTRIQVVGAPRLTLSMDAYRNLGFEGVSWDSERSRLLIVQEMFPLRVLLIDGLAGLLDRSEVSLHIREWTPSNASTLFMRDLSSVSLHEPTGHVLLLSDVSSLVVEYAFDGTPISVLPMWRGFAGLSRTVPQAEGLALGPQGELFIVSEPNLFYRFDRTYPAPWLAASGF